MKIIILGAGLSGISTAYFLQKKPGVESITLIEKSSATGGLCRSIRSGKYTYDIGPHILFSKDKEMLELMLNVLNSRNDLKRSNKILYNGIQVQYPFENDLSKLPSEDLRYCIDSFNHNPYENYDATNMIQFFLKTFGEGITNTYLRPYNEKIWKYDPAFMNTSMVERIPKPTKEEIQRSASGETVEGYLHQLYFSYPAEGGIESVVKGFEKQLDPAICNIVLNNAVQTVKKQDSSYTVLTSQGQHYQGDLLISTIPVQELSKAYESADNCLLEHVSKLRYNSIAIAFAKTPYDLCGDNFAFMIPDKDVIFHRISKMDFLGSSYHHQGETTYMVEVTYRDKDQISSLSESELMQQIKQGFEKIGFAHRTEDVEIVNLTRHQYAYVIYDLNHTANMEYIRNFYSKEGILLNGRFGNFEYWNMDKVLRESLELCKQLG
ncbi:protoporphyrinogen/coproporphyrinogen oxidase [Harryflintia acetispora]|uniref:protoporphyrinogen/coproporphyrinogen oxidase n=1 Tax=Harryflintia acetispora TaxID=1849041 RepID=UPI001897E5B4|nr:FAD-dependent oxidoreductase [Harryflintia acetispora]